MVRPSLPSLSLLSPSLLCISAMHWERAARNALALALSGGVSEFTAHQAEVYGGVESARCFLGETWEKSPASPLVTVLEVRNGSCHTEFTLCGGTFKTCAWGGDGLSSS